MSNYTVQSRKAGTYTSGKAHDALRGGTSVLRRRRRWLLGSVTKRVPKTALSDKFIAAQLRQGSTGNRTYCRNIRC